jgi:xanthine dehydrogenase accessory factor
VRRPLVAVRGGGEMATAAARLLFLCGFPVVVLEREAPLAVRRLVSFAQAVFSDEVTVEGVRARRVFSPVRAGEDAVSVLVDPHAASLAALGAAVLVDGRMAKHRGGGDVGAGLLRIALGPGFEAGRDVDAVIETQRGPSLGRVIWSGAAVADTAVPAPVMGHTHDRVLRAPAEGVFRAAREIGTMVTPATVVGEIGGRPVVTAVGGLLRGLLADGVKVPAGTKVGDVDPRGLEVDPAALSDKARAIAAGVVEAVARGLAARS